MTGGDGGDLFGNGGNGGGGGGGGSGPEGAGGSPDPAVTALLLTAGRSLGSLPSDLAAGILAGKVGVEIVKRYLELEGQLLLRWLLGFAGFRERLLADPAFLAKVAIECGIGIGTKLSAEYTKRGDNFAKEADFVAANVLMAIIADFMLVWLPAPTLALGAKSAGAGRGLLSAFAGCPDNAFQKVQPGMAPFSLGQRFGAVIRNGLKLFGVGLTASCVGVAITNSLIIARQLLDPSFEPLNQPQNILATSAAYGLYMATSSNLRYQLLAGVIEERGIETIFHGNYKLTTALSFIVRTGNTFLGSLLWVDFVRLLGMQSASH